jgi:hypothetical protein
MHYLQNEEWLSIALELKDLIERFGSEKLGIEDLYMRFLPVLDEADGLLELLRRSVHTVKLAEIDQKRDDLFRAFYNIVKNLQKQPVPAKEVAADRLFNLLDRYHNNVLKATYAKESAAVYNLLQDLRGEYAADITLLALTDWVTALDTAEQNFASILNERQEEKAKKPKGEIVQVRRSGDLYVTAILNYADGRLLADGLGGDFHGSRESLDTSIHEGNEAFDPIKHGNINYNFVIIWNEIAARYRLMIAQRLGRHAKGKDQNPDAEDPDLEDPDLEDPDLPGEIEE